MDVEKSQRVPLSVFFGIETFFGKKFFHQRAPLQFFDIFATMDVKKCEGFPFSGVRIRSNFLGFSGTVQENTLTLWSRFANFEP